MTVADAEQARNEATVRFNVADKAARHAGSVRTGALNDLNAAQKAFDAALAKVRDNAPPASDWKTPPVKGEMV